MEDTMSNIHLSDEEAHLLRLVLQARLSALAVEIAHTDAREFREILHRQVQHLETLLAKVPVQPRSAETTGYRA
jgi:hypothetical protein